jgi:hypothetical protein
MDTTFGAQIGVIESGVDCGSVVTMAIPGAFKAFHVLETPEEVEAIFRKGLDAVIGTKPAEVVDFPGSNEE